MFKRIIAGVLSVGLSAIMFAGCNNGKPVDSAKLDPNSPTSIEVWHYYNGAQLEAFNKLISEFNDTVGKDEGIVVHGSNQGSVNGLVDSVLNAFNKKAGAKSPPNIFATYADNAYKVNKLGTLVDLNKYFTEAELSKYVDSYLEEGKLANESELKILPVAKSVELLMINNTDWQKFKRANNLNDSDLETFEGITKLSELYYNWTDAKTEQPNDGKAFFGRDAMANFMIIAQKQFGKDILTVDENGKGSVNLDKSVMRKVWDNYYAPYIKGYFAASGKFRSDDVRTGTIISFIGSSSGSTYFPGEVIINDNKSYRIDSKILETPHFKDGENYAIQQGAGMAVTKSSEKEEYASVRFLKWLTEDENNIKFSSQSGYMPVTKTANDAAVIKKYKSESGSAVSDEVINKAVNTTKNNKLYTTKAFDNATDARSVLETSLSDKAVKDRKSVVKRLQKGRNLKTATKNLLSDTEFEAWYKDLQDKLSEAIDK